MGETINGDVRRHETGLAPGTWLYQLSSKVGVDLAKLSAAGHQFFDLSNAEFFKGQLPQPLITFEPARRSSLGHFRFGRNGIGARFEINLNALHLDRPLMDHLVTLLHEMDHLAQYVQPGIYSPRLAAKPGQYHNVDFQELTAAQGIPSSAKGVTLEIRDPFKAFCIRNGVEAIEFRVETVGETSRNRKRKLRKWTCQCEEAYGVWVAAGKQFKALCHECKGDFRPHEIDGIQVQTGSPAGRLTGN